VESEFQLAYLVPLPGDSGITEPRADSGKPNVKERCPLMADSKDYAGVAQTTLDCLNTDLKSVGINPPEGDSGIIEYQGVKLAISYSSTDQMLSVRIMSKPAFVPESLVWQLLDGRIQKCSGT
jgi:hypothetical protein